MNRLLELQQKIADSAARSDIECFGQAVAPPPLVEEIERRTRHQERDREVDQHHMLRVLGQQRVMNVKRVQAHWLLT